MGGIRSRVMFCKAGNCAPESARTRIKTHGSRTLEILLSPASQCLQRQAAGCTKTIHPSEAPRRGGDCAAAGERRPLPSPPRNAASAALRRRGTAATAQTRATALDGPTALRARNVKRPCPVSRSTARAAPIQIDRCATPRLAPAESRSHQTGRSLRRASRSARRSGPAAA